MRRLLCSAVLACSVVTCSALLAACSSSDDVEPAPGAAGASGASGSGGAAGSGPAAEPQAIAGTQASFDLEADTSTEAAFYSFPYPSDLRLLNGGPDTRGWPNPQKLMLVEGLRGAAGDRKAFPVVPVAYFGFSAPLPALDINATIAPDKSSAVLLIDIDEASPDVGKLYPTVATVPPTDDYVPENLLALAPRPGIVLHPGRKYAFVVMRALNDGAGAPLGVPLAMEQLKAGVAPAGARGAEALALYAPLWPALTKAGVDAAGVAAATVFSTADVVKELSEISSRVVAQYKVEITGLKVDPDDGAKHETYCELTGKVSYPQFQKGTPPFNKEGLFDFAGGDTPVKQRDEEAPVTLSLPKGPMPKGGYPLTVYFHGSGGVPAAIADRGRWHPETDASKCPEKHLEDWMGVTGCNTQGEGPAWVLGPHGIGMAASALPVNPERLPGAGETAYLNFSNLAAFRDTFRQGVIEQRLFIDALSRLTIAPEVVASCTGMSLPDGEIAYHYATDPVMAQGQSMGGMYTNMIGAVEPKIKAVVPTGAGGFWSYFILETQLIPGAGAKVGLILGTKAKLSFVHPTLHLLQTAWETSDPIVFMPRVARNPLEGHPVRPIYEPCGKGDSYFPTTVYDAVALAYGHKQAGDEIWPTMQPTLKIGGLDGILPYPVSQDLMSAGGQSYTAAAIQYDGDGVYDPHALYTQRDEVKYQYGCFLASFLKTGTATIYAPKPLGSPCE
jgi:hypothetical protein